MRRPLAGRPADPGLPRGRQDAGRAVLAPRPRPAHPAGARVRAPAARHRRALARHGLAGDPRPAPLRAGQPAGRRLVRRADHHLRPRRPRLAARAVPAGLGRRGRPGGRRSGRPLLSGLPHAGGDRVQQPAGPSRGGARGLGRRPRPAVARQGADPRSDGQRHHARHLGPHAAAEHPGDRRHRGRDGLAPPARRADQGLRAESGHPRRQARPGRGAGDAVGSAGHPDQPRQGDAVRLRLSPERHRRDRRCHRAGARGPAPGGGEGVHRLRGQRRRPAARGAGRLPAAGPGRPAAGSTPGVGGRTWRPRCG